LIDLHSVLAKEMHHLRANLFVLQLLIAEAQQHRVHLGARGHDQDVHRDGARLAHAQLRDDALLV